MAVSKHYDLDTDNTLSSNSDNNIASQKAVKSYVDTGLASKQDTLSLEQTSEITLATVATSGSYNDLSNKPTIGNGTITITQGGNTKGTFTVNQSGNTTVALDGGSTYTAGTGIDITSNTIKATGVENVNGGTEVKTWTGTLAQYNAIASKDSNTIYNITDDEVGNTDVYTKVEVNTLVSSAVSNLLSTLYPVNSIYISTASVNPLATLISGSSWTLVGQDRVLQGAGTRGAVGTTVEESLPNIKGSVYTDRAGHRDGTGALSGTSSTGWGEGNNGSSGSGQIIFNAHNSNATYQDNAPVQQDAYLVNIWRRVL